MRIQSRCVGSIAVTLVTVAAVFGEAAPAVDSSQTPASQHRVISLEERADIYMARKNYADAADYYYQALKQSNFKNPMMWNKLGIAYQGEGKFHNAQKAYSSAIHESKDFADAWNNLGTVYFMEKKYGKSVKFYQRAIALRGDNAAFHLNIGVSYLKLKKFETAVQEYDTALGLDPNILTEQSLLASVIQASDSGAEAYFYMAKAFARKGRAEESVRYLRRALEDGLKNQKRIDEDPDFEKIKQYPAYVELMRNPPVAIKD
jgi:tetratricopeptide (TPR) repeat protein